MNYYDKMIDNLHMKNAERIGRARALSEVASDMSDLELYKLVDKQINELKQWPAEKLIEEFIDIEELAIRGLLGKLSLKS